MRAEITIDKEEMMRRMTWAMAAAVALLIAALPRAAQAAKAEPCGRACLEAVVDRYLAALAAHDPTQAPLAKKVKLTENGQLLAPGDGLWGTATGLGKYKLYVADPEEGAVGFMGVVLENDLPVILALRLKVKKGRITEIEQIVAREAFVPLGGDPAKGSGAPLERQGSPHAIFLEPLAPGERVARPEMIAIANSYFSALERNDGKKHVPFDKECNRQENGFRTTNNPKLDRRQSPVRIFGMSCEEQFKQGYLAFVTAIRDRRFAVVDEERGLVLAFGFFDHSGAAKTITLADGRTIPSPVRAPLTFEIAELFKIKDGRIRQIEATLITVPYSMKSAWDESNPLVWPF